LRLLVLLETVEPDAASTLTNSVLLTGAEPRDILWTVFGTGQAQG
jgi:hypothetical protein